MVACRLFSHTMIEKDKKHSLEFVSICSRTCFLLSSTHLALPVCILSDSGKSDIHHGKVIGLSMKDMPGAQPGPFCTYGTCGDSLNLMKEAWSEMQHMFSVQDPRLELNDTPTLGTHHISGPRFPRDLLNKYPVDLLVIECGRWQCPKPSLNGQRWESLMVYTSPEF